MDSPKTAQLTSTLTTISTTATIATSSSESPPDSFSDFVNNLFPAVPVKCDSAAQGSTGLESPPFVFSSPHLNANVESNLLKRTHYAQSYNAELVADPQKYNNKISEQTKLYCPTGLVDNFLADYEEVAGTGIMHPFSKKGEENLAPEVNGPVKIEKEQSSTAFYSTESDMSASQAFKKQENEYLSAQDTCTLYQDALDFTPQSLHEELTNDNSHGAYERHAKETLDGAFQPLSVAQPQPSMCQRYLQFKEATANAPQNYLHSSNFTSDVQATSHHPSFIKYTELSALNLDSAFNNRVPANSSRSLHTLLHPDSGGNPPLGVSKPSGIGLHLNSVINVAIKNHGPIAGLCMQGGSCHILKNDNTFSGDVSSSVDDKEGHERKAISLKSSITLESLHAVQLEKFETPYETRNFDFDQSFNLEKNNNLPPKRKRKKSSVTRSGDGSKRCNCKKSKCLKLYCDCFAAGIYCAECSCQGCFNNPENEHTVFETRHQIESRDPLAFAPKVIEDRNELLINNENGRQLTPSLARHKRGCNCKKSMCLKQYCECFQANVGCTIRCRCEDCRNVHGKKEHCVTPEVASGRADVGRFEGRLINDHDTTAFRKDLSHSEFYGQQHNLAPQTPSFQYSDHEKDSPKSRLMSRRCLTSPEFDATSASSPDCNDMFVETKKDILDVDSCLWHRMNCDNGGTSTSSIPSKPRGWINVSRTGWPCTGGCSVRWHRSPDTPLIQACETSIRCTNGSSPKKQVLPLHGSENEVGMNDSSGWLKGRRYLLKSMPPVPPLTPRNESRATNDSSGGSDYNDINSTVIEPQCRW